MRLNKPQLREALVSALEDANALAWQSDSVKQLFLSGERDIAFEDLDIDSLAAMQFCIAIEARIGLSVAPRDLQRLRSLEELIRKLYVELDAEKI